MGVKAIEMTIEKTAILIESTSDFYTLWCSSHLHLREIKTIFDC